LSPAKWRWTKWFEKKNLGQKGWDRGSGLFDLKDASRSLFRYLFIGVMNVRFFIVNMSIEIPILYNKIRREFNTALENAAEGEFVQKPESVGRYARLRIQSIRELKQQNRSATLRLDGCVSQLVQEYGISPLEATDITLRVWDIENRLKAEGAFFGTEVFNFALSRPVVTNDERAEIETASNDVMGNLISLAIPESKRLFPNLPMFPIEEKFDSLGLTPNAARIDFILTANGPKIIEVNSQWVDAINALAAFASVFGDQQMSKGIIERFARSFKTSASLALIDVPQTTGSRALGATKELEKLASRLLKIKSFRKCEVVDPEKVRTSYLEMFDSFYVNADPRSFGYKEPDWMELILKRVANDPNAMFPRWRPMLDKKFALTLIPNQSGYVTPSVPLAVYDGPPSQIVLKGDGYSLNSVSTSFDKNFIGVFTEAQKEPLAYIVQPFLEGKRFSSWVYDTGAKKIRYIADGYTKLNVWWINGQVVGMLTTISDSRLISDKGFNTIPLIK